MSDSGHARMSAFGRHLRVTGADGWRAGACRLLLTAVLVLGTAVAVPLAAAPAASATQPKSSVAKVPPATSGTTRPTTPAGTYVGASATDVSSAIGSSQAAAPPLFTAAASQGYPGCTQWYPTARLLPGPDGQVATVYLNQQYRDECGGFGTVWDQKPIVIATGPAAGPLRPFATHFVGWKLMDATTDSTGIYLLYVPSEGSYSGDLMLGKVTWDHRQSAPILLHRFGLAADPVESASITASAGRYFAVYSGLIGGKKSIVATSTMKPVMKDKTLISGLGVYWTVGLAAATTPQGTAAYAYLNAPSYLTSAGSVKLRRFTGSSWLETTVVAGGASYLRGLRLIANRYYIAWDKPSAASTYISYYNASGWHPWSVPFDVVGFTAQGSAFYAVGRPQSLSQDVCRAARSSGVGRPWTVKDMATKCIPLGVVTRDSRVVAATESISSLQLWQSVPAPAVSTVSANVGTTLGGTTVTITGSGLTGVTRVTFGTTAGTSVHVLSSSKLTVHSPKHAAGVVNVVLTGPGGSSVITTKDRYTFVAPPVVKSVTGASGATGSTLGGNTVIITGSGFTGITAVEFGSTPATAVKVLSSTKLTAVAPPHYPTVVNVLVTGTYGRSAAVTADHYTFVTPPAVTSVAPMSGSTNGANTITITGTGFTKITRVTFGTTAGTSITILSATMLTVVAPQHTAGTVDLLVTGTYGTSAATSHDHYAFLNP